MIETQDLRLTCDPNGGFWQLESRAFPHTYFRSRLEISGRVAGRKINLIGPSWQVLSQGSPVIEDTQLGPARIVRYDLDTTLRDVTLKLSLGLLLGEPLIVMRITLKNEGQEAFKLESASFIKIASGDLLLGDIEKPEPCFYANGWQSWSRTGVYGLNERQKRSLLGKFQQPMVVNPGTPQPKQSNHFSGDLFGVVGDRRSRVGLLSGFLSQREHFGSLETHFAPAPSLEVWANGDSVVCEPGERVLFDDLTAGFIHLDAPDPFESYCDAVSTVNQVVTDQPIPVGWCSWYHFYTDISEEKILTNLDTIVNLTSQLFLPLFQIDDGFETYPGDWFDFDPEFPDGVRGIAQRISREGRTPGLWLAPYIVHPKSNLVKEHPEWLLRDESGKPVTAGFVWNAFTYALDLTHPDAYAYSCNVVSTAVKEWGFTYLKLDFLYAAALKGRYQDPTRTRAQVLRKGLEGLREAAGPQTTLLACGCPIGSALGLFDAMRISADVSGNWKPQFPPISPILKNEPHMPSAQNAIHNILTRASLHRHWWINDPDCLLVRPDSQLTLPEVQTLATTISLTGGSLLLSDDLPALPPDRIELAQRLLPLIGQRAHIVDLFDAETPSHGRLDLEGPVGIWHNLALFNWSDQPASLSFDQETFGLPVQETFWWREFWTGEIGVWQAGTPLTFNNVAPHGVRLVAIRAFDRLRPTYLGSSLHISQGIEVSNWQTSDEHLQLQFKLNRTARGKILLYLPWSPTTIQYTGESLPLPEINQSYYTLDLIDPDGKTLEIRGRA